MRFSRLVPILATAALALSCGEGKAIFDVDVLSFMSGAGNDTLPFALQGGVAGSFDLPPIQISLVQGIGKAVDTVSLQAAAAVINNGDSSGTGTVDFQVFFASDSASTFTGTPYIDAAGSTAPTGPPDTLSASVVFNDSLFSQDKLWVGVRLGANAGTGGIAGTLKLSALHLRIVLEDNKGF